MAAGKPPLSDTLFLVFEHVYHEGSVLVSTHRTIEQAVAGVTGLLREDSWIDTYSVVAVAPGPGAGMMVARWASKWVEVGEGEEAPTCEGMHPHRVRWERVF